MTKSEFDILEQGDIYWTGRWEYFSKVINIVECWQQKYNQIPRILEIGPNGHPLFTYSSTVDIVPPCDLMVDISKTPWGPEILYYDFIVALQVFEHLPRDTVNKVFYNMMSHTTNAIVSLPLMWDVPDDIQHHKISINDIDMWFAPYKSVKDIVIPRESKMQRIIRHYHHLITLI